MKSPLAICGRLLSIALLSTVAAVSPTFASGNSGMLSPPARSNWQADGSYRLVTDDPQSIQIYYRDVGVGPLTLPTPVQHAAMRETCLSLGALWRPLGHVEVPGPSRAPAYKLELCYFAGPNPPEMAATKCTNLGMVLLENRPQRREIVCTRRRDAS